MNSAEKLNSFLQRITLRCKPDYNACRYLHGIGSNMDEQWAK